MANETLSRGGMVVAPHHLAAHAGRAVLAEGGNAVEAALATAAALTVVYPHMNSLGGDGFWLIAEPGRDPVAIDACGRAGRAVTPELYREAGLAAVPWRGPLAANTVAGMVSGWAAAHRLAWAWGARLPLSRLFAPAIDWAEGGCPVADSLAQTLEAKRSELESLPHFTATYPAAADRAGASLTLPAMGRTLRRLAAEGLGDYYRGGLARDLAAELATAGSPLTLADLEAHRARLATPLSVTVRGARLYNLPAPTQGFASLAILALFDRLNVTEADGFEHLHGLVEATKRAFRLRDRHFGDPGAMTFDPQAFLADAAELDRLAADIDPHHAMDWPQPPIGGDTVWFGALDAAGRAVSVIQSTYFEFGSGVILPSTGVVWQNRGASFTLEPGRPNSLAPGRKPFHTLNPALARFDDGRVMAYGTMGGEGQPQTQAAVFSRYAMFGQGLQAAVSAPRWLLGRTWGEASTSLKLEDRFPAPLIERLRAAGHAVERAPPYTSLMGHAGAAVRHPEGGLEGAADPRSDGAAAGV